MRPEVAAQLLTILRPGLSDEPAQNYITVSVCRARRVLDENKWFKERATAAAK